MPGAVALPEPAPGSPAAAALALARRLAPEGVALAAADPAAPVSGLLPGEAEAVARAVPRRRREFAAGRRAARAALAALGLPPVPLPPGPDRAPVWPEGVAGSISHVQPRPGESGPAACLAAVAREMRGLGIDLEDAAPLAPALWPEICTPAELALLGTRPEAARGRLAKLVFCVKEAAWKAQFPVSGTLYGFEGMRTELAFAPDGRTGAFSAIFEIPAGPFRPGDRVEGRFATGAGLVAALAVVPGPAS